MNKFQQLSDNLALILTQLASNQNLCKYISIYQDNPLSQPDIPDTSVLFKTKLFPYPFVPNSTTDETVQIHAYFPRAKISNRVIENVTLYFDVICHKNLWLFQDNNKSSVRPYQIMSAITDIFDEQYIGTLGKLLFEGFDSGAVDDTFQLVRLAPKMINFGTANL